MMVPEIITSGQNPKIKELLALQEKSRERRSAGLFVVEGQRELDHCIAAGFVPDTIFICPEIYYGHNESLPCHPERCPEPVEGRSEGSTPVPIVEALRQLGVPAELTGRNDIFVEGRKVSGYARRVSKRQEIIHGTLMYDVDLDTLTHVLDTPESKLNAKGIGSVKSRVANLKDYLPGFKSLDEVQAALQDILASGDYKMELTENQLAEIRRMADEKFSTWDFIYGRSRQADLFRSAKLPCGTVEAAISLDRGLITGISFSGDFMFDEPVEGLAAALVGCRFEHDALASVLGKTDVSRFFRDTNSSDVLDLILT